MGEKGCTNGVTACRGVPMVCMPLSSVGFPLNQKALVLAMGCFGEHMNGGVPLVTGYSVDAFIF